MLLFTTAILVSLCHSLNFKCSIYCWIIKSQLFQKKITDGKGWLVNDASWVTIGTAMNPVTKMICVKSHIWCACGSQIKIYSENAGMLELVQTIQIIVEGNQMPRGVTAMVAADQHVWIAVQATSIIKCYSTSTYECMSEINVGPDVVKILAGL